MDNRAASNARVVRITCLVAALAIGAADAWVSRFTMFPDGISYLDLGDAYWRADSHTAINAYWSPLYPWILGLFLKLLEPTIQWEYPVVHLVNFLMYATALACFDYFLRAFLRQRETVLARGGFSSEIGLPVWAWWVAGYSIFVSSSLLLITIRFTSGDIAVAAIAYLIASLLLRIRRGDANHSTFAWLGFLLGLGYLAKTAMFVVSIPILLVALAAQKAAGKSTQPVLLSAAMFLMTAAPLVLVISRAEKRPTFGESGRVNYETSVNGVGFFIPNNPEITHPVQKISALKEAYVYGAPISGTYPLWFDPTYWHDGIRPQLHLKQQLRTVFVSLLAFFWVGLNPHFGLGITAAILFLFLVSSNIPSALKDVFYYWELWVPAVCGIGIYSLVIVEPRYVAAFFSLLWMVGFACVRLPDSSSSRHLIVFAVLVCCFISFAAEIVQITQCNDRHLARQHIATSNCWEVAQALRDRGIGPGSRIAVIGSWLFPAQEGSYVARLAGAQIVAEARADTYWRADVSVRSRVSVEFARAGASAVVARLSHEESGWERLNDSDYYLYRIRE